MREANVPDSPAQQLAKKCTRPFCIRLLVVGLICGGCSQPHAPRQIPFPPPPAKARLIYLGRVDQVPIDAPPRDAFHRWLHDSPGFLQESFVRPYGLTTDQARLYVCDAGADRVVIMDFDKQQNDYWEDLSKPVDIALLPPDRAYVAEAGAARVAVFESGKAVRVILSKSLPFRPIALAGFEGTLYVADVNSRSVLRYRESEDEWLTPLNVSAPPWIPGGLCLYDHRLFVTDALQGGLSTCALDGRHCTNISMRGDMLRPKHITADDAGNLLLVDAALGRLHVREPAGGILLEVDEPALLDLAAGIEVSCPLLARYRRQVPSGFAATSIVVVSVQGQTPGLALFLYAAD